MNPIFTDTFDIEKNCIDETDFPQGKKFKGKVRDIYDLGDSLHIITTDRLSAFDRQLALIPFKGKVLNQISAWWFEKTKHIIANHVLDVPAPNAMHVKKCDVFPVEFVVRGYITGSTDTSLWTQYQKGVRNYCGNALPEGLVKNQQLAAPLITPTTKEQDHDRPISPQEIIEQGLMSQAQWDDASEKVLALYRFGVEEAAKRGWILVDTKYELGVDAAGEITLIDEVHTPDSSRYWRQASYASRFAAGEEPESFDKEFVRLWFKAHCDPYHDEVLPEAPRELVLELASRYLEMLDSFCCL